ncbi:BRO-N domain-containing protein [Pectobacterium brasiliense]|uniref:BRO-N domain-containing protein n=1 Tax=Pectobacterium brasiliense TaxID=180957 RepID=UPI004044A1C4
MNTTMSTTNTIKVTKMNFAGLKLDVITGHPDHELLFVATQVATAMQFANPKSTLTNAFLRFKSHIVTHSEVQFHIPSVMLRGADGRCLRKDARMLTESQLYEMILRTHTPQGEPFRKWVTEEVLPTIRKTGSYNVETSKTPEGIQFASEFRAVNAELKALRGQIEELKAIIQAQPKVTVSARRLGLYSRVCLKIHDKAQGSTPEETPYISMGLSNPSLLGETA